MPRPPTFPATRQISGSTTVPAPTGGLNAISPISNMAETDAIIMRNFFPEPFGCRVRKGYKQHATGLDGAVASILTYLSQDGTKKVFKFISFDPIKRKTYFGFISLTAWVFVSQSAITAPGAPQQITSSGYWSLTSWTNDSA